MTHVTQPLPTAPDDVPTAPADRSAREGVIRDLYALAEFYSANPTHPLPVSISVNHYVPNRAQLQEVAYRWCGGQIYGSRPQCDHELPNTSTHIGLITALPSDSGRPL